MSGDWQSGILSEYKGKFLNLWVQMSQQSVCFIFFFHNLGQTDISTLPYIDVDNTARTVDNNSEKQIRNAATLLKGWRGGRMWITKSSKTGSVRKINVKDCNL